MTKSWFFCLWLSIVFGDVLSTVLASADRQHLWGFALARDIVGLPLVFTAVYWFEKWRASKPVKPVESVQPCQDKLNLYMAIAGRLRALRERAKEESTTLKEKSKDSQSIHDIDLATQAMSQAEAYQTSMGIVLEEFEK